MRSCLACDRPTGVVLCYTATHPTLLMLRCVLAHVHAPLPCRGLKAAMIEREDFASGTSSKSTKLVHGGVRYLEKAGVC
jgi:hypothetical protein